MAMFAAMQAAASGMNVFKTWIDTTANNVANQNSVSLTPGGEPFQSQLVIAQANEDPNNPGAHVVEITNKNDTSAREYDPQPIHMYERGSWGPPEADDLIAPRKWHVTGKGDAQGHMSRVYPIVEDH